MANCKKNKFVKYMYTITFYPYLHIILIAQYMSILVCSISLVMRMLMQNLVWTGM